VSTILRRIGFAAFVALTISAAAFAGPAAAAPPLLTTVSAETMTLPTGASSVRDRNADGGRAAQFTRNGAATASITTASPIASLTLTARGTQCSRAWPQLSLSIDGAVVLSATANRTAWTSYSVSGLDIPAGTHSVSLAAANTQRGNCERFLFADLLSVYGPETLPPPPPPEPPPPPPPPPGPDPAIGCQQVIVPAYSYPNPTTFWDNAITAANPVQFVIADPANGPGRTRDARYVTVIARAQAAGIRVMGYVDTAYGLRSASSIKTDITTWRTMYGLTDIFFDQTASSGSYLAYYRDIANFVHATPGAITMLNPGVNVDEGYMQVADILNIFEGSRTMYASFAPAGWVASYPRNRFSHLIYSVSDAASMTTVLNLSATRGAGYVYITSDGMPNPWDVLPPYWAAEVAQIRQACAAAPPV
jgi:Spherulation-specific family 4